MNRRRICFGLPAGFLAACRPAAPVPVAAVSYRLLEPPWAGRWEPAGIPEQGKIALAEGELSLEAGGPMTGARFAAWGELELGDRPYTISYAARRLEGEDFFGTVTFPVPGRGASVSFVLGGWGGSVMGISSIDFSDANENSTRGEHRFSSGNWYRVRLTVTPDLIEARLDERLVVSTAIKGRQIGLRPGFIDHCLPFGFASYGTFARIKDVIAGTVD